MKTKAILNELSQQLRRRLGPNLRQLVLFGSRARRDNFEDSDYDILAIVDIVSPEAKAAIDDVAGQFIFEHDVVFSIFPIEKTRYHNATAEPFLRNAIREGISL